LDQLPQPCLVPIVIVVEELILIVVLESDESFLDESEVNQVYPVHVVLVYFLRKSFEG